MEAERPPEDEESATSTIGRRAAAGFLLAPILLLFVPVVLWFASSPVSLTSLAKVLFVLGALALCAFIGSSGDASGNRWWRFAKFLSVLLLILALPALALAGCSQVLEHFGAITTADEIPSPNGRLVLVEQYVDSGALGGDTHLEVRGRLLPGLVNWDYYVPLNDEPSDIGWADDITVSANGHHYRIPDIIAKTAW
jgi:hypothetical protein